MTKVAKEFRDFVAGGNMIELAVAFIMGGLFAKIIESLVTNILMPIIGIVFGEPNFDRVMILTINDSEIKIGAFLTVVVAVLLTALGVFFLIVKPYNRIKKQPTPADVPPTVQDLLTDIRDILATRR